MAFSVTPEKRRSAPGHPGSAAAGHAQRPGGARPELSIVIPVYNSEATLELVVHELRDRLKDVACEVILVDDGSSDASAECCRRLARQAAGQITVVELTRNFGEHSAVLAGLAIARGEYVGVMDDDGQHPPAELLRLWRNAVRGGHDVVFGRQRHAYHATWRRWGSQLHHAMATAAVGKPRGLYLSSFKVLRRPVVEAVLCAAGPTPYLDALVLGAASRPGQLTVEHRARRAGRSGYTFARLLHLSLDMLLGHSRLPARLLLACGLAMTTAGCTLVGWRGLGQFLATEESWWLPALFISGGLVTAGLGVTTETLIRVREVLCGEPPFLVRAIYRGEGAHDE